MDVPFGFAGKLKQLAEVLSGSDLEPHEVSTLLKHHGYNVEVAAGEFFEKGRQSLPKSRLMPIFRRAKVAPTGSSSTAPGKRSRPEQTDTELPEENLPGKSYSAVQVANMLKALSIDVKNLPRAVALEIPTVLREQAQAQSDCADLTHLQRQVDACVSCSEIGKLPWLTYLHADNTIVCDNCSRWAFEYKKCHEHANASVGTFVGEAHGRPMTIVRSKLKEARSTWDGTYIRGARSGQRKLGHKQMLAGWRA